MSQLQLIDLGPSDINQLNVKVDGKIINELSKQVSSHLFALGELLKNSYDAKATIINITLDKSNNKLTISDNGTGISQNNVLSLLHIGKSNKNYGKQFSFTVDGERIVRFTQGSKGLGLLCAFKFGDIVTWASKYKGSTPFELTINKNKILNSRDITKASFPIKKSDKKDIGTSITINLDPKDKEIDYIYDLFLDSKNSQRLVNFFYEDNINIKLKLIDEQGINTRFIETTNKDLLNNSIEEKKIFDINYSSLDGRIIYIDKYNRKHLIEYIPKTKNLNFEITLILKAYSLQPGDKKKFDSIFINRKQDLTPLIYINKVLFNNDQLFDPSITRSIKSSKTMSQITGFIEIICTSEELQFNNERTDLIINSFNQELRDELNNLNIFLQAEGKKIEREIKNTYKVEIDDPIDDKPIDEPKTNKIDDKSEADKINDEPENDKIDDKSEADKINDKPEADKINDEPEADKINDEPEADKINDKPEADRINDKPEADRINDEPEADKTDDQIKANYVPFIKLKTKYKNITFSDVTEIIDLLSFYETSRDSKGNLVPLNEIIISINNEIINPPFIQSIDYSTVIKVKYLFKDKYIKNANNNFVCSTILTLNFQKRDSFFISDSNDNINLIKPFGNTKYQIQLEGVDRLIQQINSLYLNYKDFDMCLASSLRVVFDLTTYRFQHRFPKEPLHTSSNSLEEQVKVLITRIASDKTIVQKISQHIGTRFRLCQNILIPGNFSERVLQSNLGSHTGSSLLSEKDIQSIAMYAGYYAQLVDAYCTIKGHNND